MGAVKQPKPEPKPVWPFPTQERPLKPWTPKQIKEYETKQRDEMPDALM